VVRLFELTVIVVRPEEKTGREVSKLFVQSKYVRLGGKDAIDARSLFTQYKVVNPVGRLFKEVRLFEVQFNVCRLSKY